MEFRILGKGLKVNAIGFGCMGISHAYGEPMNDEEAIRLIRNAYEIGYNFFDTAKAYIGVHENGLISDNEEILGKALKDVRDKVVLATKFGIKLEGEGLKYGSGYSVDSRPETIRKSLEESLKKLNTDYIDLYYQHRVDPKVPLEEVAGVVSDLIKEGKVLHWGISEADEKTIRIAHKICPLTAIQNRYSMMARWNEALFPVLEELNIGLVAFSPIANGYLSLQYDKNHKFDDKKDKRISMPQFSSKAEEQNVELIKILDMLSKKKSATPAQISLAWMICKKPWIVPIPGTRKIDRLEENFKSLDVKLTLDEVKMLDEALETMNLSDVYSGIKQV